MDTVKVKIKRSIAAKGCGFCDIGGKQNIFPPRDKDGKPDVNSVFHLKSTSFVESKIATGELVLVGREGVEGPNTAHSSNGCLAVKVNGKVITELAVPEGLSEDAILELVEKDAAVRDSIKGKNIKSVDVKNGQVLIAVK
ncbi:MAG: hypothetical protein EPN93_17450 [Spirochaetes bacterium]|nr:MAG: hypothetical protein EPN93_17450 [Spirochaetota bacterium]